MPGTLEEYFELLAIVSEASPKGFGMSISEYNELMPWHLEALLQFRKDLRDKYASARQKTVSDDFYSSKRTEHFNQFSSLSTLIIPFWGESAFSVPSYFG